jgi:DNA polymerase III epsilon subunit family exonuclease
MNRDLPDEFRTFVAGDTETTGTEYTEGDRVVEFAFIRFQDGIVVDKIASLVFPHREIPPRVALKSHRIFDQMVAGLPDFKSHYQRIIEFIGNDPLVFHNAKFDMHFLAVEALYARQTWSMYHPTYCTLENAVDSGLFEGKSLKLSHLAREIKLPAQRFHRAEPDAYAAGELLLYMLGKGVKVTPW